MNNTITNVDATRFLELGVDPNTSVEVLEVTELVTRDASITEIVAKIQNDIVTVTGTARRCPGDKPNDKIGVMLATARAYAALAKRIEKRARGLVEHCADIQAQRPIQRKRSAEWQNQIMRLASNDDAIQKAALTAIRHQEGSWQPTPPANLQVVSHGQPNTP